MKNPYECGYSKAVTHLEQDGVVPYTKERLESAITTFEKHQYSPNLDEWDLGYIAAFKAQSENLKYPTL
jgi:hypothetical protein